MASGREQEAEVVVLATGAWRPFPVADPSSFRPSGMPVLLFAPDDPEPYRPPHFPVWGADIARTGWYGFPAGPDGVIKIGHHGVGYPGDPEDPPVVAAAWEARCRAFLRESLPGLASAPLVGTRTCFYCDSRDGDFWIDRDPQRPGLVVATGGSGHGFKFAPVLGGLVADVVEGGAPQPRFRWRPEAAAAREEARYTGD
jgi:glycine/D-amino acid oxidase-like deaminating enzyme